MLKLNVSILTLMSVVACVPASEVDKTQEAQNLIDQAKKNCAPKPDTSEILRSVRPAISVRATSCIMCHSKINSSLVTDFGQGDDFFMGGKNKPAWLNFYVNHWDGWQTSEINGSVIVPKVELERKNHAPLFDLVDPNQRQEKMSLADYLQSPTLSPSGEKLKDEMVVGVHPEGNNAKVIEKDRIYIGAPTEEEIKSIAPTLFQPNNNQRWELLSGKHSPASDALQGLEVIQNSKGNYVRNVSNLPLVCEGDVVVKGPLLLKNLNLQTGNSGCRIYVLGSVFIQGGVNYVNQHSKSNLQITSTRAIMMGFSAQSAKIRLSFTPMNDSILPYYNLRGNETALQRQTRIYNEALLIPELVDADQVSKTVVDQYNFEGILLNAPQIHSRYIRPFTGALVAELIIFRLGKFEFNFDSVFSSVEAFPALKKEILTIRDNLSSDEQGNSDQCTNDDGDSDDEDNDDEDDNDGDNNGGGSTTGPDVPVQV